VSRIGMKILFFSGKLLLQTKPIAPIAVEILFCVCEKFYLEGNRLAKKIATESGK